MTGQGKGMSRIKGVLDDFDVILDVFDVSMSILTSLSANQRRW